MLQYLSLSTQGQGRGQLIIFQVHISWDDMCGNIRFAGVPPDIRHRCIGFVYIEIWAFIILKITCPSQKTTCKRLSKRHVTLFTSGVISGCETSVTSFLQLLVFVFKSSHVSSGIHYIGVSFFFHLNLVKHLFAIKNQSKNVYLPYLTEYKLQKFCKRFLKLVWEMVDEFLISSSTIYLITQNNYKWAMLQQSKKNDTLPHKLGK